MAWQLHGNTMATPSKSVSMATLPLSIFKLFFCPSARVVMIVQPGERNAFDQRWIEYTLLEE